jgi:hypothetical protein
MTVDILEVEEKCFEDMLYQAAKLLFTSLSNWAHFVTTLVYLSEDQSALRSTRKARNSKSQYFIISRIGLIAQGLEADACLSY